MIDAFDMAFSSERMVDSILHIQFLLPTYHAVPSIRSRYTLAAAMSYHPSSEQVNVGKQFISAIYMLDFRGWTKR
jgi:hypothetical protein